MNKVEKVLLYVTALFISILLINSLFFSGKRLKQAIVKINDAQTSINKAMKQVNDAKAHIDSLQLDLSRLNLYVKDIQGRVEIMDLQNRLNEARFTSKRDSIKARLKSLYNEVELVGEELPEIPEVKFN